MSITFHSSHRGVKTASSLNFQKCSQNSSVTIVGCPAGAESAMQGVGSSHLWNSAVQHTEFVH